MAIRIYAFQCGGDRASKAVYDPLDSDVATIVFGPYFFFLIRHPLGNVLFDTGLHLKWRSPGVAGSQALAVEMGPDDDAVSKLAVVGLGPEEISHVIVSHLHFDHAGGLQFFPDADIIVQERELQFAHWPSVFQRDIYDRDDFDHKLRWVEINGDYDVFGDGKIVTTPTPGHTPGHQSAIVRLDGGMHVLAGDAHYLCSKMRQRRLPAIVWNIDEMYRSWLKLEELERMYGARLIFTHEMDPAEAKPVPPDHWYE
jgi:N-acyl homoserine lactone hydrolase